MDDVKGKPTRGDLVAAGDRVVPDVIGPGLELLFCGINPGLYSAYMGHHFARPGNRFWPVLYAAGFTPRQFRPDEEQELLPLGIGITNIVSRASAVASELTDVELRAGAEQLLHKVEAWRPRVVAVLGITAFRSAFQRRDAQLGRQAGAFAGAEWWVLPNPSGLNAHYTAAGLAAVFQEFRLALSPRQTALHHTL